LKRLRLLSPDEQIGRATTVDTLTTYIKALNVALEDELKSCAPAADQEFLVRVDMGAAKAPAFSFGRGGIDRRTASRRPFAAPSE